jgi:hypothetical protein
MYYVWEVDKYTQKCIRKTLKVRNQLVVLDVDGRVDTGFMLLGFCTKGREFYNYLSH